jgi:predicted enzyme related to lactoylglutathione lyase
MTDRDSYPPGVPCWVETLQADVRGAMDFYGSLFDWEFAGPGPLSEDAPGQYFVARLRGRDVAGIGSLPEDVEPTTPAWLTYVRTARVDETVDLAKRAGGTVAVKPVDAPPAGRLAVVADPAGARIGLWEAGSREGAQLINVAGAWALSSLRTTDPEGVKTFYGSLFGWQAAPFGGPSSRSMLWRLPGYVGGQPEQPVPRDVVGMVTTPGGEGSRDNDPPHWSVDFWVDDVDSTAAAAAAAGAEVIVAPFDTPGFRSAFLADPQGAAFSISQFVIG